MHANTITHVNIEHCQLTHVHFFAVIAALSVLPVEDLRMGAGARAILPMPVSLHRCVLSLRLSLRAAGNPWAENCDGMGMSHRMYTIRKLSDTLRVLDGVAVDYHDLDTAQKFENEELSDVQKRKFREQSDFGRLQEQGLLVGLAATMAVALKQRQTAVYEAQRRGRCVCPCTVVYRRVLSCTPVCCRVSSCREMRHTCPHALRSCGYATVSVRVVACVVVLTVPARWRLVSYPAVTL